MLFFKGGILASIYPFSAALILVGFDMSGYAGTTTAPNPLLAVIGVGIMVLWAVLLLPVSYTHLDVYKRQDWYSAEIQKTPEDLRNALLDTYANFLEDKITGNDRDLTVTETGEIQQRCRELWEKCRET